MRKLMSAMIATTLIAPAIMAPVEADARHRRHDEYRHHSYKEWRGRDGRMYCRKSNGTTGLLVGAAGGALLGRSVDTRGDRATGTIVGAAAGALIGKSLDSGRRCR